MEIFQLKSIFTYVLTVLSISAFISCSGTKTQQQNEVNVSESTSSESPKLSEITQSYFDLVRPIIDGETAYETTAFVEKYWRVVGNTGFNESIYWITKHLEEAGYVIEETSSNQERLTYRIEKRALDNPTWEPVSANVSIVGQNSKLLDQTSNRNMVFLNSKSTPNTGVEAEVIYIKDKSDLKTIDVSGKILFAEMSGYYLYGADVFEKGALGIMTYDNPAYLQPEKNITSIQFRSLPAKYIDKAWGIALSYEAKEKLKQELSKGKVSLKVNIKTKSYKSEELTVVATIKGSTLPNESLVFSAHIQEPGANDNATGVGTQLEMAMATSGLIKRNKLDLDRTLTFLWGDEIVSTRRYIKENPESRPEIKWGISLDMVGENTALTGGSFLIEKMPDPSAIYTRGNDKHTEWGGKVLEEKDMKPHYLNDFILSVFKDQGAAENWEVNTNPFEGGSDHTPFLDSDIPGLLLWHFTDQFYHTDNDRIDKVSKTTMKNVGTAALVSAYTLLNSDEITANAIAQQILKAAEKRLEIEFILSKAEISSGKNAMDEIKILKSWNNWYEKALMSVNDIGIKENDLQRHSKQLNEFSENLQSKLKTL
ncbi:Peptidase family M28 [Flavobacteriaceae bacterium MAR_2010_188]|nr:Peptidase family M28 [Flavobacteriaceae bacterium MAR_2010_188]